jgi:glycosyltransferase involved in cell wall biosynthesis
MTCRRTRTRCAGCAASGGGWEANVAKIVIDARESGTSTGRYIDKLIEYLAKLEPAFEMVVLAKPHRLEYLRQVAPGFDVQTADYEEFSFAEQLGFKKRIKGLRPDLVHFPAAQQPIWYRGAVVTTIQDLTTVRFTNPNKNLLAFKFKQMVYKYVVRRVARKSAALLAISRYVKEDIVDYAGVDPAKVTVTYEAAEPFDEPAEPIPAFKGKRFIMFNGRPLPHKNLERLIEAFAQLRSRHPDLYLMIAGKKNKSHDTYLALAKKLKISDRVILTDWITDGQLKWAMQNARAYVYPSLSEGFGLPPLEAMLNGAPVVASNATCIPEVCGDAARYFDPLEVQSMADAIDEVLTDKKLRAELVKRGQAQVKKYSWQRMAKQTLAVYEQVLRP